jgi:hypothetical protein
MGYSDQTTKHYRVYAPDVKRFITASTVKFYEDVPGGTIDLKLKKATPGGLPERRPVGRPKKQEESTSAPIAKRPVGRPRKQPDNTKSDTIAPAPERQNQPANLIGSETPILVPEASKSDSIEVDETHQ